MAYSWCSMRQAEKNINKRMYKAVQFGRVKKVWVVAVESDNYLRWMREVIFIQPSMRLRTSLFFCRSGTWCLLLCCGECDFRGCLGFIVPGGCVVRVDVSTSDTDPIKTGNSRPGSKYDDV